MIERIIRHFSKNTFKDTKAEFEKKFPNTCAICSYGRHLKMHHGVTVKPIDHDCKERKK